MEVFATFYIYNSTGHRVAEGHKASFCLEDNQCLDDVRPRYACADFGDQGNFNLMHKNLWLPWKHTNTTSDSKTAAVPTTQILIEFDWISST